MTTGTAYNTEKHLFEQMPNDSVTCRWCGQSPSNDLHSNVPTIADDDSYNPFCTEHQAYHGEQASRLLPCVAKFAPTRTHTCIDSNSTPTGLFCVACVEEREGDQTATTTTDNDQWRLSSAEVNAMVKAGIKTPAPLTCIDIPKHYGAIVVFAKPEVAAQIVSEHNAVAKLVDALDAARAEICRLTWNREKPNQRKNEALIIRIDAALTTLRNDSVRE